MSKITVDRDSSYAPCSFLICRVTGSFGHYNWNTRDEANTVLVQCDTDYPSLALSFGWRGPCCSYPTTDGTVDCDNCGCKAVDMIADAADFLDNLDHGSRDAYIDDPGYFDDSGYFVAD